MICGLLFLIIKQNFAVFSQTNLSFTENEKVLHKFTCFKTKSILKIRFLTLKTFLNKQ